MQWAGLLGSPRRTSDVSYFGAQGAATWHPEMLWMAFGGVLVATSVLLFIIVATGTYLRNERAEVRPTFAFAPVEDQAMPTPAILDKLGRFAVIALVLAVLAYAGPVTQEIQAHPYLAPGMRTW
jgi:cytochrome c oxidase subunit 1